MKIQFFNTIGILAVSLAILFSTASARAGELPVSEEPLPKELSTRHFSALEELLRKSSSYESVEAIASYYAKKFVGRRTSSGHRYNPDKMTAAHESLPLGTVVRVLNPETKQEVHVTINDRCAPKSFHFIDLSRAAAKKIGLWGKGRLKVVIFPLLEDRLEEPA